MLDNRIPYVEQTFGYDLNRTCDEIRPTYHHVETCQEIVPEAIIAFLESVSFEDALRNAVSLGGDSDTLALHPLRHCRSFLRDAAGTAGRDFKTSAGGYPGSI